MGVLAGRFPDDIAAGVEGGHGYWGVTIVEHAGGQETANLDATEARGRWRFGRAPELTDKHMVVRSYYYKARSSFHKWRMKDWHDFICDRTGNDKGRLTGSVSTWRANKVYGADDPTFEYVRRLFRIVAGTEQVWRNGALQTRGVDYTINNDTGVITSAASWAGSTLEFACQFDVLCRFDGPFQPRLLHKYSNASMLFDLSDLEIVEVLEDDA